MKDIFVIENMIQLGNAEAKKKKKNEVERIRSRGNKRKIKRNK